MKMHPHLVNFKSSPCNFRSGFLKAEVQKLKENKQLKIERQKLISKFCFLTHKKTSRLKKKLRATKFKNKRQYKQLLVICDGLRNLVPFAQFKTREKYSCRSVRWKS